MLGLRRWVRFDCRVVRGFLRRASGTPEGKGRWATGQLRGPSQLHPRPVTSPGAWVLPIKGGKPHLLYKGNFNDQVLITVDIY